MADPTTLTPIQTTLAGAAPNLVAVDGVNGNRFLNSGKSFLHVKNDGASPINVVAASVHNCNYGYDHDITVAVANGAEKMIGPFPRGRFNDANGYVVVTFSGATSVTAEVVEVP